MAKKSVTIKDIAKLANCTPATVSMVLNNRPGISEETCEKVLLIAKELDYRPNMVARSLVSQQSKTIGLIINNFYDQFFAHIAEWVEKDARKRGYTVFICSLDTNPELEEMYMDILAAKRVDGIIFSTVLMNSTHFSRLDRIGLPYVFINRTSRNKNYIDKVSSVAMDNELAGFKIADHLYRLGHDRIGLITGDLDSSIHFDRTQGAKKAFAERGLEIDASLIVDCKNSYDIARRAMGKLLKMDQPPTAVFAGNDTLAFAARETILAAGLSVPEDVALVGFDNISVSGFSGIDLTTVKEKGKSMGTLGVNILIDLIENKASQEVKKVVLNPELIIRKSCGYDKTGYVR